MGKGAGDWKGFNLVEVTEAIKIFESTFYNIKPVYANTYIEQ